ncbi:MAG TPA: ABC transporter permease [Actinomycetes bacterium]|nr:ABC transporter permease [Actinomycetes bacterium]
MSDSAIRDGAILSARSTRMSWRNLDALITAVMLPVIILVLFVYLFGGAIDTGTAYVDYVAPSVILLCTCLGASTTAVSVSLDLTHGVVDRFRAMDVSGVALLGGHVVASVARNAISTALVFAVAYLIGFRPNTTPLAWLGVAGLLGLFVLAISWLAAALGLLVKSPEAANGVAVFLMFLPYPSSAFVPIATMPTWLAGFAEHQPATPIIETLRGLLLGMPIGSSGWLAIAWCAGILVASMLLASLLYRRRTS